MLLAVSLRAQTPQPETLRANAKLVIVDVTVTDKQGHPVHNLKQSDFGLLENKTAQTIKSFEEHTSAPAVDTAKIKPTAKMPPDVFTNEAAGPVTSTVNVLLLDTLNTPVQDQIVVRQQLLDYLAKERPGAKIAIFGLNSKLIMLQDFTSDPEVLKQAVKQQKNVKASPVLDEPVSGNDFQMQLSEQLLETDAAAATAAARTAEFEAIQQTVDLQTRAKLTLEAMNQLARYLAGIPGRKNLIWFSGSFPIVIFPDIAHTAANSRGAAKGSADPFASVASSDDEFRQTIDLLSRDQIAVYPVHAHGLESAPMFSAENGGSNGGSKYTRNPAAFANDQQAAFDQTAGEHSTMIQLADATGGEVFLDTNGLSEAVAKAIDHGASYYTLTYTPANDKWTGDYRAIQVTLQQQGLTLNYRRGYYADDPNAPAKSRTKTAGSAASAPNSIQIAMQYDAPPATQIHFKVRVLRASASTEDTPAPGNTPNPDPRKSKPPYRRYAVDYLADTTAIQFDKPSDGSYREDLEFVICVYDVNGELINVVTNDLSAGFTRAQYIALVQRGLPFHQEISVPVKGLYMLRVAIHDLKSDRVGALDAPVTAVGQLAPSAPSSPQKQASQPSAR
jgi:VWFA-related protein